MTAVESVLSDFYLWVGWEPYTWLALFMVATLADAGNDALITSLIAVARQACAEITKWIRDGGRDCRVRANVALQATGTPFVVWVLADNTTIQATAAELTEALALAGAAQAALWVAP